ncbi:hypothetical protein THIOM_002813 [Candidatus Thiomargarita nelsonii]|uniref:Uncharacterized protein n=1 Tax=Candidatus Thiomargarita nelsonii TaxID=1003181 RepID=A0A176S080_9GAMM|nr:hypothetical protein THIOM_002813 [Candidatus Thiomargarita nelsonii]
MVSRGFVVVIIKINNKIKAMRHFLLNSKYDIFLPLTNKRYELMVRRTHPTCSINSTPKLTLFGKKVVSFITRISRNQTSTTGRLLLV